jgi:ubiquinone/menaquinone biosynthesis C-methylase UbiE
MSKDINTRVCPVERAGSLDNSLRRLVHNPSKILKPFIKKGMTVLDLGCGPGFFTTEIANMLDKSGKVIAADFQQGMLDKVKRKILGTDLEQKIELHKCLVDRIGIREKVDFVLAFYMVHEVPDQANLFKELKSLLKPGGQLYIIEPKFHVSGKAFDAMIQRLVSTGFEIAEKPGVFFSRAVLLTIMEL